MHIDITTAQEQLLADRASAHGFARVDEFVNVLLANVASLSEEAAVFAPLDDQHLAESDEAIYRGEADIAAGRIQEMRQGLIKLGAKRGLRLGE